MFQLRQSGLTGEEVDQMTYVDAIRFFMFQRYDGYVREKHLEQLMKKKK